MNEIQKIEKLANEIKDPATRSVLYVLIGALKSGMQNELSHYCSDFARNAIRSIKAYSN